MNLKKILFSCFFTINLLSCPAMAWSKFGHETVAMIAEDHLTGKARQEISIILSPGVTLLNISTCADSVRNKAISCGGSFSVPKEPETSPWHFINLPVNQDISLSSIENYCKDGNCVTKEINNNLDILKSPGSSKYDKQVALMFVVHLLGDLHEPLHCSDDNDNGGNKKNVTINENSGQIETESLHHLWDNIIFADKELKETDFGNFVMMLERDITNTDTSSWLDTSVEQWTIDSYEISKNIIYPEYIKKSGSVDEAYQIKIQKIAFSQLEKAGIRLAKLLNDVFK